MARTRTRSSAKQAGTRFETLMVGYLQKFVDGRIERRAKTGAKDRGDVSGVRGAHGGRVVIEAKNYGGRIDAGTWTKEAEVERGNDDAVAGVVFVKRMGTNEPGKQWVLMTAQDFVTLLTGKRPEDD